MADEALLRQVFEAVAAGDEEKVQALLAAAPGLARAAAEVGATRAQAGQHRLRATGAYVYEGDTALHVAAASHRPRLVSALIGLGAEVSARNRRGAEPLHYAADGSPGSPRWRPDEQAGTIAALIAAGADPNAANTDEVTPLHRAVRTRSSAAVRALLEGGADPKRKNKLGSTPMDLATRTTGRGGSGSPQAKAEQAAILRLLEPYSG